MNKCYQLIGIPGAGKSTWIKNQTWALGMPVVGTDMFVEMEAHRQGKTYTEVFEDYMPVAVRLMVNHALTCQSNRLDFIWDQVVQGMISNWEEPTLEEGFKEIWRV